MDSSKSSEEWIEIKGRCPGCGMPWTVSLPHSEYDAWRRGKYIQKACPSLDDETRELLLSGFCGICWDKHFKDPDQ